MTRSLFWKAALLLWLSGATNAFVSTAFSHNSHNCPSTFVRLGATYDPYDDSSSNAGRDALDRNKARTDIRNFLTQRSIQSFVYLANQCREEHIVRWLEVSLERYHFL